MHDLYTTLELPKSADSSEIRKQYLKLSRIHHPDKAPAAEKAVAEEKFKKLVEAYEILSDDSKRSFYDQTGKIPGENGGGPPPFGHGMHGMPFDMNGLFGMFGGGRGGPSSNQRRTRQSGKAPSRKTQIPLTLKDFYYGRTLQIQLERQRFCTSCKGEGATSVQTCGDCNGAGTKMNIVQMGPMILQNVGPCMSCRGSGKTKGDSCNSCTGSKFVKQDKTLELVITKGMKTGQTIVFAGESSHNEDYTEAGDVVVELVAADEDHSWERSGDMLKLRVGLTLGEALCGKVVKLDGHPGYPEGFYVQIPAGVQNRQEILVEGCGMPRTSSSSGFGDAILLLSVVSTKEEKMLLELKKSILQDLFSVPSTSPEGMPSLVWQAKPISY
jgi:DnaJ-class molecular chaperone